MRIPTVPLAVVIVAFCRSSFAAEKPKPAPAVTVAPSNETLDLDAIARIRDEDFHRSHVMEYSTGLFDGIGPRLTASPDFVKATEWSMDQLRRMGVSSPHPESWESSAWGGNKLELQY